MNKFKVGDRVRYIENEKNNCWLEWFGEDLIDLEGEVVELSVHNGAPIVMLQKYGFEQIVHPDCLELISE